MVRVSPTFPPVQAKAQNDGPRAQNPRNDGRRHEPRPVPTDHVYCSTGCGFHATPDRMRVGALRKPDGTLKSREALIAEATCSRCATGSNWPLAGQLSMRAEASRHAEATPQPRAAAIRASAPLAPPPAKKKAAHHGNAPQARGEISSSGGFGTLGDLMAAKKNR